MPADIDMRNVAMSYQDALDDIYHWYMDAKPAVNGRLDRDVRDPQIIVGIARKLDLLPDPARTVRVTGSKGKGTVSRTLANALTRLERGPVGLLVSPEEFEHTDRMQIDGAAIGEADFLSHYRMLRPHLGAAAETLDADRYLSPSGIFLLIALSWFMEHGVATLVLETGRGAKFDETGQIPSAVSVVTSIFEEHAGYLGPGIKDIAADKLHISRTSGTLVLGPSAAAWEHLLPAGTHIVRAPVDGTVAGSAIGPAWLHEDAALARSALCAFLGRDVHVVESDIASAAYCTARIGAAEVHVEPLISAASIDEGFLNGLMECYGDALAVVASLPDDKGIDGVVAAIADRGLPMFHIVLHGTRGYLSYEMVKSRFGDRIAGDVRFDDVERLRALLIDLVNSGGWRGLYIIGTHTFVRGVKLALRDTAGGV